jgi:hypothetical protein
VYDFKANVKTALEATAKTGDYLAQTSLSLKGNLLIERTIYTATNGVATTNLPTASMVVYAAKAVKAGEPVYIIKNVNVDGLVFGKTTNVQTSAECYLGFGNGVTNGLARPFYLDCVGFGKAAKDKTITSISGSVIGQIDADAVYTTAAAKLPLSIPGEWNVAYGSWSLKLNSKLTAKGAEALKTIEAALPKDADTIEVQND